MVSDKKEPAIAEKHVATPLRKRVLTAMLSIVILALLTLYSGALLSAKYPDRSSQNSGQTSAETRSSLEVKPRQKSAETRPSLEVVQKAVVENPTVELAHKHVLKLYVPPVHFACKGKQCGTLPSIQRNTSRTAAFCAPKLSEGPYKQHYLYFTQEMLLSEELRKRTGTLVEQTSNPFEADIVLCRSRMGAIDRLQNMSLEKGMKRTIFYILVEDSDGASVCAPPRYFEDPGLLGVLKHYAWTEHEGSCNPPLCRYRSRDLLDAIAFKKLNLPHGPLKASAIDGILTKFNCTLPLGKAASQKVMVGIPSPVTLEVGHKFMPLEEQVELKKRSVDVAFVGRWPMEKPELDWHRSKLVSKLRNLGKKHGWTIVTGTRFNKKKDFMKLLYDTKVFVSPWGLGEWSGKDEDAILAGAVLMKPGASLFEATIPIYTPNVTCLDVRLDWQDLEGELLRVLGDVPRLEKIRQFAYSTIRRFSNYSNALVQEEAIGKFEALIENAKKAMHLSGRAKR